MTEYLLRPPYLICCLPPVVNLYSLLVTPPSLRLGYRCSFLSRQARLKTTRQQHTRYPYRAIADEMGCLPSSEVDRTNYRPYPTRRDIESLRNAPIGHWDPRFLRSGDALALRRELGIRTEPKPFRPSIRNSARDPYRIRLGSNIYHSQESIPHPFGRDSAWAETGGIGYRPAQFSRRTEYGPSMTGTTFPRTAQPFHRTEYGPSMMSNTLPRTAQSFRRTAYGPSMMGSTLPRTAQASHRRENGPSMMGSSFGGEPFRSGL